MLVQSNRFFQLLAIIALVIFAACSERNYNDDGKKSGGLVTGEVGELLASGNRALANENWDSAVIYFESAFASDNNSPEAIVYSTLAKIAQISVDPQVVNLFRNRFGFRDYPNRLNALLSDEWMTTYRDKWRVWDYFDENMQGWVRWHDRWSVDNYEDIDRVGYWYQDCGYDSELGWRCNYVLVSETPLYEIGSEISLPGLGTPSWLVGNNNSWYNETLIPASRAHSFQTWVLLLFANLIDKNTNGFNAVLDETISAVFGQTFNEALNRIKRLENNKTATITLDRGFIESLYLEDIIDQYDRIGWAEINAITSAMIAVKASLEWVAAYDWNTNLSVFRHAWENDDNYFFGRIQAINKNDLPFNNNFLNARPGKMAVAKNSFIASIQGLKASYDVISRNTDLYPSEFTNAFPTMNEGMELLISAIQSGQIFYVPEDPTRGRWPTSARNDVLFGVDMGLFFQEGYFSLKNVFETDANGRPVFYAVHYDGYYRENKEIVRLTLSNYLTEIKEIKTVTSA